MNVQNSSPNKNDLSAKVLRAFTGVMIIIVIIRKWDPQESAKHSHNCIINGTPSEEERMVVRIYEESFKRMQNTAGIHINQRFRIKSGILSTGGSVVIC